MIKTQIKREVEGHFHLASTNKIAEAYKELRKKYGAALVKVGDLCYNTRKSFMDFFMEGVYQENRCSEKTKITLAVPGRIDFSELEKFLRDIEKSFTFPDRKKIREAARQLVV